MTRYTEGTHRIQRRVAFQWHHRLEQELDAEAQEIIQAVLAFGTAAMATPSPGDEGTQDEAATA